MPRKADLLNSLSRGRVRASWNKHNLFNLYKKGRINFQGQNLYQQKWTAKQETRAYHGEFITESRFQTNFSSKLESVANLDASLRGDSSSEITPYTLQTYAVLEKRLDFALFRAMFASSVRQARQFVLHGYVSVNGIKIREPGFQLTPGDIFNIEPDKALYALGAFKPSLKQAIKVDQTQVRNWNSYVTKALKEPKKVWEEHENKKSEKTNEVDEAAKLRKIRLFNESIEKRMLADQRSFTRSQALKTVLELGLKSNEVENYKTIFSEGTATKASTLFSKITESSFGFKPEELNELNTEELKSKTDQFLSTKTEELSDSSEKQFSEIKQLVSSVQNTHHEHLRSTSQSQKHSLDDPSISFSSIKLPYDPSWTNNLKYHKSLQKTSEILESPNVEKLASKANKPSSLVNLPWQKGFYGHETPSKPYFTPWKLRPFIAPFAILPHHLEISFKTCHAVYLRDPVSMSGKSEVITPFDSTVHERAYMWYIRRVKTSKR